MSTVTLGTAMCLCLLPPAGPSASDQKMSDAVIRQARKVLILVPAFFALMKERALRRGALRATGENSSEE